MKLKCGFYLPEYFDLVGVSATGLHGEWLWCVPHAADAHSCAHYHDGKLELLACIERTSLQLLQPVST